MHDQADQLRRLVRQAVDLHGDLAPGAPLIAVTGAQTGVGATTVVACLARELASLGKHVVVVDANLSGPALAPCFDANPPGNLAEVLAGERRAIEVLVSVAENIQLLGGAAASDATQLGVEAFERLHGELTALGRHSDAVLIDAGSGMTPWIDRLWQLAQQVLLVARPASSSIVDAYAAIKQSHSDRTACKLQLVVTRCDAGADAARFHAGLSATCERFLGASLKPPAVLPTLTPDDASFLRSVRLLAADLACDFRALGARVPARRARSSRLSAIGQRTARFPASRQSTADS